MNDIKKMVDESVAEINRANLEAVEAEVKSLVKGIIRKQADIKRLSEEICKDKDRLKSLNVPGSIVLEI